MSFKKSAFAVATAAALGLASSAFAGAFIPAPQPIAPAAPSNEGWYVTGLGGVAFTSSLKSDVADKVNYKTAGFDLGGSIGYRMGPFSYEAQYLFMRTNWDSVNGTSSKGRTSVNTILGNVYYNFQNLHEGIIPYIGAGIGWAHSSFNNSSGAVFNLLDFDKSDNEFAYTGLAGVNFAIDNDWDAGIGYQYFGTSRPEHFNRIQNNLVNVSLTYHIPE